MLELGSASSGASGDSRLFREYFFKGHFGWQCAIKKPKVVLLPLKILWN